MSIIKSLTAKQSAFCAEFIANGGDIVAAYQNVYKCDNLAADDIKLKGYEILNQPNSQMYINQRRKAIGSKTPVDSDLINEALLWAMMQCRNANNPMGVSKIAMDLAKMNALIVDRSEVSSNHTVHVMPAVELNGEELTFNIGKPADKIADSKAPLIEYDDLI